jgi:glycosyltransferase involved in cell wall biosynthesis
MKFSLLIPIAIHRDNNRRAEMLENCLQSILRQSHDDYEVVLKDAFPDEPVTSFPQVANTMKAFGTHLKYVISRDGGIRSGTNQALHNATGDVLYILCGDDALGDSDTLSFVSDTLRTSEPAWMYGNTGCMLEDGKPGHWEVTPFATLSELLQHNRMGGPAVFWNREMFQRIGYFDKYEMANDYDYWCRCYRITRPTYVNRVLGIGRRWSESASRIGCELVEREASEISLKHTVAHARGETPIYVPYAEEGQLL